MSKVKKRSTSNRSNSAKTLLERARREIPGFSDHIAKFEEQITIGGYSQSTVFSYSRAIASISLHFGKCPLDLDDDEINSHLFSLAKGDQSPSQTYFKHMIYGLRFFFRVYDREDRAIRLPGLKRQQSLPVVLSRNEVRKLLKAPARLKQRVIFALIYSAGLRVGELCRLKIGDIDSDRMQIRIVQSKGGKDRYVILSQYVLIGLRKYIKSAKPIDYLFNGRVKGEPLGESAVQQAFRLAVSKAGITKEAHVHTLRHSYATHLLEEGVDLVSIKELLGHSNVQTTMMYLHVARISRVMGHSPLDTLYQNQLR